MALLAVAVTAAVTWSGLPDPVATHWTPAGRPDGQLDRSSALLIHLVLPAVFGAMALGAQLRQGR